MDCAWERGCLVMKLSWLSLVAGAGAGLLCLFKPPSLFLYRQVFCFLPVNEINQTSLNTTLIWPFLSLLFPPPAKQRSSKLDSALLDYNNILATSPALSVVLNSPI